MGICETMAEVTSATPATSTPLPDFQEELDKLNISPHLCRLGILNRFEELMNQLAAGWKYHVANTEGIKDAWDAFEKYFNRVCTLTGGCFLLDSEKGNYRQNYSYFKETSHKWTRKRVTESKNFQDLHVFLACSARKSARIICANIEPFPVRYPSAEGLRPSDTFLCFADDSKKNGTDFPASVSAVSI